jgi:2-dehydro-3-deoxyphosphooctonate aldolase (KDO 8-P synthase)
VSVAQVRAGDAVFGDAALAIIAGPCVIESEESCLRHATRLAEIARNAKIAIVFKSSFDKANRTSITSYRGPGLEAGLKILARIKRETGLAILTDVHEPAQCAPASEVVDILQIPAFLSRQTDLIVAAARTGSVVNIKKGQFLSPWDMRPAIKKIEHEGNRRILLTERGASFGYNNLVSDMRSLVIMRGLGYPVIFDATHSVQLPGAGEGGASSGGQREFAAPLARAAVATGVDGIFMEVHENPDQALSDGANNIPLDRVPNLIEGLKRIHDVASAVGARD